MDIRKAVKAGEVRPTKSLGQNFLIDAYVVDRIVSAAELDKSDLVIEIGAGAGALTKRLSQQAGFVVAVEIDRHLINIIERVMSPYKNYMLVNGDILKLDIHKLLETLGAPEAPLGTQPAARSLAPALALALASAPAPAPKHPRLKIISNLPYYITTPVIMKILEGGLAPAKMVFMMQKEVADRIVAHPSTKAYGALTVSVNYYTKPRKLFSVPPHCFVPQPGVESAVLAFEPHDKVPVELLDKQNFFTVVRAAFAQRRKQLANCLIHAGLLPNGRESVRRVFEGIGMPLKVRGEELSIHEFAQLSNAICVENLRIIEN